MKVALIQFNAGSNKQRNVERALAMTEKAILAGAKLIVLPEVFVYRGPQQLAWEQSEYLPGESITPFMALAKAAKVGIIPGSIHERAYNGKKIYNTAVFLNQKGEVEGKYRKIHLFKVYVGGKKVNEAKIFAKGTSLAMINFQGFKIGLALCYDLRFPDLFGRYSRKGCDVLVIPSAFTYVTGQAHWEILLRSRAIDNLSYVIAPNQVGIDSEGMRAYGHSMVINPWGEIISQGSGVKEQLLIAEIDKRQVVSARVRLPDVIKL